MVDDAYDTARNLLNEHIQALHAIAGELMEKETIEAGDFAQLMKLQGLTPPAGKEDIEFEQNEDINNKEV